MGKQQGYLQALLSNIFSKDPSSILGQLLGAIGSQLDQVDPVQTQLALEFAVSTATGAALDKHGKDFGVPRRLGEADSDYQKRILAVVPVYTTGPTVSAMSKIVQNYTGVAPILIEWGPEGFTMGVSPMGEFVFSQNEDVFSFEVQVQNPNNVAYKRADMEAAVNTSKPARSTATFIHQGGV